jgi:hypothetical protein
MGAVSSRTGDSGIVFMGAAGARGRKRIGVYFHVPGNYQVLEEILTTRSKKSKKFLLPGPFFSSFFDLCDFEVNYKDRRYRNAPGRLRRSGRLARLGGAPNPAYIVPAKKSGQK